MSIIRENVNKKQATVNKDSISLSLFSTGFKVSVQSRDRGKRRIMACVIIVDCNNIMAGILIYGSYKTG